MSNTNRLRLIRDNQQTRKVKINKRPPNTITNETTEYLHNINCFVLNSHKTEPSMDHMGTKCDSCESFLGFGQEPHVGKDGKISGLNYGHKVYKWDNSHLPADHSSSTANWPRAYLHVSSNLNSHVVQNLCTRDLAVAIIDTNTTKIGTIMAISLYWHNPKNKKRGT